MVILTDQDIQEVMDVSWALDSELGLNFEPDYPDSYIARVQRLERTFGPTIQTLQRRYEEVRKHEQEEEAD